MPEHSHRHQRVAHACGSSPSLHTLLVGHLLAYLGQQVFQTRADMGRDRQLTLPWDIMDHQRTPCSFSYNLRTSILLFVLFGNPPLPFVGVNALVRVLHQYIPNLPGERNLAVLTGFDEKRG